MARNQENIKQYEKLLSDNGVQMPIKNIHGRGYFCPQACRTSTEGEVPFKNYADALKHLLVCKKGGYYEMKTRADGYIHEPGRKKPFQCTRCPNRFAQKIHIIRYLKTHQNKQRNGCQKAKKRSTKLAVNVPQEDKQRG